MLHFVDSERWSLREVNVSHQTRSFLVQSTWRQTSKAAAHWYPNHVWHNALKHKHDITTLNKSLDVRFTSAPAPLHPPPSCSTPLLLLFAYLSHNVRHKTKHVSLFPAFPCFTVTQFHTWVQASAATCVSANTETQNYLQLTEGRTLLINFPNGPNLLSCSRNRSKKLALIDSNTYLRANPG